MLNTSNRNVPTRRVEFQNVTLNVTHTLKADSTERKSFRLRTSADMDQALDRDWQLKTADCAPAWDVVDVEILHSFVDSTEQYLY